MTAAAHRVFVVLLALGAALRVLAVVHGHEDAGAVVRHVGGLVVAVLGYAVLVRSGVWRWLALLAALPALLDGHLVAAESASGARGLLTLAVVVVVTVAAWRPWPRPLLLTWTALAVVAVVVALLLHSPAPRLVPGALPGWSSVTVPGALLVVGAVVGVLGAVGLLRAAGSSARTACAAAVVGPLVAVAAGHPAGSSWTTTPSVVVWWPTAGALGLTALLRGRRGRATDRPQADDVDAAALADFAARHGSPSLAPVAIVIAAYNEAEGLPGVLGDLPTEVSGLSTDVVVVDDGSSDGTSAALVGSRAYTVTCPTNRGQGAALRLGYRLAREHGARFVITTDADGQYDVGDFPAVLAPLLDDTADFVTGSRVLGRQHTTDRVRRTGVHVFAWLASALTGRRLTDTSFGLRAMRAEATATVTLNQPQYQSSELLLGMISHGYRVVEVPGTMHVRSAGASKKGRNLVYGSRYARVVLGTWWREGCPTPTAGPGRTRA